MKRAREIGIALAALTAALLAGFGAGVHHTHADTPRAFCPIGAGPSPHAANRELDSVWSPQFVQREIR